MCRSESPLTDVLPSYEPGSASYSRNGTQAVPHGGGVLLAIQPTTLVSDVAGICSRPNWGMRIVFCLSVSLSKAGFTAAPKASPPGKLSKIFDF